MKTINFSEETILKAVGSIKCYGYIEEYFIKVSGSDYKIVTKQMATK